MIARLFAALRPAQELSGIECMSERLSSAEGILKEADRYALCLSVSGSALLLGGDEADAMRMGSIDAIARQHFDGRANRARALSEIPDADAGTDSDPEGVLYGIQASYGDAGFYLGIAVGMRLAALTETTESATAAPRADRRVVDA